MSENAAYLRLDRREAVALIEWFWFQEQIDTKTETSIRENDVELLRRIVQCVMKMKKSPNKYVAMRLSPESCKIAYRWYSNLPSSLVDPRDSEIHVALGMFLGERQG